MRAFFAGLLFAASGLAWASPDAVPTSGQPLGYADARHLLNRTGFGATDAEVRAFAPLTRAQAVERLMSGARREAILAPPALVEEAYLPYYRLRQMRPQEQVATVRSVLQRGVELRAWWLHEMLLTPSPFTERMTLFWHGHFATSLRKVRNNRLMYHQNVTLRREALGNFGTLLHAVARDPAMLVYLDNGNSRRGAPNENFAREVMELFTLGIGRYGESDVREAARAFTGWSIERDTGEFTFRRAWHDGGEKTVLGRTGRLDGAAVLDLLLEQPQTADHIVAKLWREFVSPTPDPAEARRLAAVFRDARYEIKPLMRALLASEAFWSPANRASLIKSPVDLVVGTMRTFGIRPMDLRPAVFACAALGQNLLAPPNVKGWAGGEAWIDSGTLLARKQWLERVFRGAETATPEPAMMATDAMSRADRRDRAMDLAMSGYGFDADRWVRALGTDAEAAERVSVLALAMPPVVASNAPGEPASRVRALVADPAFQLR